MNASSEVVEYSTATNSRCRVYLPYLLQLLAAMDEEAAAAQSLLFSQVHFVIVQSQSLKVSEAGTVCVVKLA